VRGPVACPVLWAGQETCHDGVAREIACAGSGQDAGHRHAHRWPEPRFETQGDFLRDRRTGLTWSRHAILACRDGIFIAAASSIHARARRSQPKTRSCARWSHANAVRRRCPSHHQDRNHAAKEESCQPILYVECTLTITRRPLRPTTRARPITFAPRAVTSPSAGIRQNTRNPGLQANRSQGIDDNDT